MMRGRSAAVVLFVLAAVLGGCRPGEGACSVPAGEDLARFEPICRLLDERTIEVREATVLLGDASGRRFTWTRGSIAPDTAIELASATKWLAAATLLRLVETGDLRLDQTPQEVLSFATDDASDPRSRITLAHLLSFTSGFELGPFDRSCVTDVDVTLQSCAATLYDENHVREPGTGFYYGPAHLQLAGAMAEVATGRAFADLFVDELASPLGMTTATLTRPSRTNPRVAGGGTASAEDYERFLLALLRGELLGSLRDVMHADHTPVGEVEIVSTPLEPYDLAWHYSFGNWRECPSPSWSAACDEAPISSSPGAFGFTPWIDWTEETFGVIAVKRSLLVGPAGDSAFLAMEVRDLFTEARAP